MSADVERIEQEILALEEKLARAKQKRQELQALDPEKRLAVYLHEKFCPYNHTDGCGWGYESGDSAWIGNAHTRWLKHARELLTVMRS